eukprot:TRINITY_DN24943_c0_g1_i1.p1 TRINITY_DN24943_c0_g1~~TRINITY_DN24943_c0_g1_i1.p1  ORF type:complete len:506 (+),score=42.06 TRINITY_DN24943_c0_g1_i1:180-1697(+)
MFSQRPTTRVTSAPGGTSTLCLGTATSTVPSEKWLMHAGDSLANRPALGDREMRLSTKQTAERPNDSCGIVSCNCFPTGAHCTQGVFPTLCARKDRASEAVGVERVSVPPVVAGAPGRAAAHGWSRKRLHVVGDGPSTSVRCGFGSESSLCLPSRTDSCSGTSTLALWTEAASVRSPRFFPKVSPSMASENPFVAERPRQIGASQRAYVGFCSDVDEDESVLCGPEMPQKSLLSIFTPAHHPVTATESAVDQGKGSRAVSRQFLDESPLVAQMSESSAVYEPTLHSKHGRRCRSCEPSLTEVVACPRSQLARGPHELAAGVRTQTTDRPSTRRIFAPGGETSIILGDDVTPALKTGTNTCRFVATKRRTEGVSRVLLNKTMMNEWSWRLGTGGRAESLNISITSIGGYPGVSSDVDECDRSQDANIMEVDGVSTIEGESATNEDAETFMDESIGTQHSGVDAEPNMNFLDFPRVDCGLESASPVLTVRAIPVRVPPGGATTLILG